MTAWEYKNFITFPVLSDKAESDIESLGSKGWEMVGLVSLPGTKIMYVFKRAKE